MRQGVALRFGDFLRFDCAEALDSKNKNDIAAKTRQSALHQDRRCSDNEFDKKFEAILVLPSGHGVRILTERA
jgi:hypothetical protein